MIPTGFTKVDYGLVVGAEIFFILLAIASIGLLCYLLFRSFRYLEILQMVESGKLEPIVYDDENSSLSELMDERTVDNTSQVQTQPIAIPQPVETFQPVGAPHPFETEWYVDHSYEQESSQNDSNLMFSNPYNDENTHTAGPEFAAPETYGYGPNSSTPVYTGNTSYETYWSNAEIQNMPPPTTMPAPIAQPDPVSQPVQTPQPVNSDTGSTSVRKMPKPFNIYKRLTQLMALLSLFIVSIFGAIHMHNESVAGNNDYTVSGTVSIVQRTFDSTRSLGQSQDGYYQLFEMNEYGQKVVFVTADGNANPVVGEQLSVRCNVLEASPIMDYTIASDCTTDTNSVTPLGK